VRFERIVQLIEEDRQAAVTLAQRGRQHGFSPAFTAGNSSRLRNIFLINELLLLLRYRFDPNIYKIHIYKQPYIYISSRSVAEEFAEPEDWLASIQPKLGCQSSLDRIFGKNRISSSNQTRLPLSGDPTR
jgi:hypothetical protein